MDYDGYDKLMASGEVDAVYIESGGDRHDEIGEIGEPRFFTSAFAQSVAEGNIRLSAGLGGELIIRRSQFVLVGPPMISEIGSKPNVSARARPEALPLA